jgi:type II secretory pathway component PulM
LHRICYTYIFFSTFIFCGLFFFFSIYQFLHQNFLAELQQEREKQEQWQAQLQKTEKELSLLRQELDDVKTAAAMSEQAKADEVDGIRQHYEQELSSMQQLLGGTL